ncbi:MAG TPA: hypothetical protein VI565_02370 [Burkholderiales bacterium]|nr:hypothetical protein [Burkholderiales bacterium]
MWRRIHRRLVGTPVDARAGYLDPPVSIVLCASLALSGLLLAAVWLYYVAA